MTDQLTTQKVPDFPRISARFARNGDRVELQVMDTEHTFDTDHQAPARVAALSYVVTVAAEFKRPVRVRTSEHGSTGGNLIVTPDGAVWDEADPDHIYDIEQLHHASHQPGSTSTTATGSTSTASQAPAAEEGLDLLLGGHEEAEPAPAVGADVHDDPAHASPTDADTDTGGPGAGTPDGDGDGDGREVAPDTAAPQAVLDTETDSSRGRHSFLQTEIAVAPARQGWRGALNRLGLGLGPGPSEADWREDVAAVSEHWTGPKTIAVANPKGSANKTPTAALLAAVFARYGGAGVLAWDNNETRGSLAWRTQRARHDATVLDLLPRVGDLLSATAQAAELTHFTHHQPADKYDVLQSDQSVAGAHEVSAVDVDQLHQVVSRYYRLTVMDSGNSERAANWRAMIERSAVLVVPCTNSVDTPEAGRLMLESLHTRDAHSAQLARNAVAIVSQRDHTRSAKAAMDRIVAGMQLIAGEVIVIPFDPAMKEGVLQFDALRPATQRAWLRAGAAVARRL